LKIYEDINIRGKLRFNHNDRKKNGASPDREVSKGRSKSMLGGRNSWRGSTGGGRTDLFNEPRKGNPEKKGKPF